jgi:hypothetical protein
MELPPYRGDDGSPEHRSASKTWSIIAVVVSTIAVVVVLHLTGVIGGH